EEHPDPPAARLLEGNLRPPMRTHFLTRTMMAAAVVLATAAAQAASVELLNVSYDPTRELWRDLNASFAAQYQKEKGVTVAIKHWPDLVKPGVEVITPNPKTSGNGYLSFFSAWGSVVLRGGSRAQAVEYVTKLYRQVPVLDSGARGATVTFVQRGIGDVHLSW